jgi:hypothetical protein
MKHGPLKTCVALLLCFMLPITVSAQNGYTHTPGVADIITQEGNPKSLVVQILNLTEYNMELTGFSDTLHDETDRSRHTAKSFMFAPLGLPQTIPPLPQTIPPGTGDPQNAKPYTAMLAWDDGGTANNKYAVNNWLLYTLQGVDCTDKACVTAKENVDLAIWITRSNPDKGLTAQYYYQLARNVLREVLASVAVVLFPEVPPVWANFLLSTASLTKTAFNAQQEAGDVGHKWYVASFPVPSTTSLCYAMTSGCYPSSAAIADDAVDANWGPGNGGPTQSRIVVVTQVLQGHAPTKACNPDCSPYANWGQLGSVPVLMVTVMTTDVWYPAVIAALANCKVATPPDYCPTQKTGATAAAGAAASAGSHASGLPDASAVSDAGAMIHAILEEHGREGRLALGSVVRSLNPVQRQLLGEMYQTWRAGEPFTPNEQGLLHLIAVHLRNAVK